MGRYTGPVCRLCRREGVKLFLKGARCNKTDKCAFERRSGATVTPGEPHRRRGRKYSEYRRQLREKQKAKRTYGIFEKQFKRYFENAERMRGITGENFLRILESRFDNIVYKLCFATSRSEARQLINHNHFLINGERLNIPSYQVKPGDVIQLRDKSKEIERIQRALEIGQQIGVPEWLELDVDRRQGVVKALPTRDQISMDIQEQVIVELYSK